MPGELLKSAEVAELLRVHPKQVYRLLKLGLPGRRVGGEWRFVRADVLRWADQPRASTGDLADANHHLPSATPPLERTGARAAPPPFLAANGDVLIEVLLARLVAGGRPLLGFVQADAATALRHLRDHRVLLAGYHAETPPTHFERSQLESTRLARIHLARREIGLAFPSASKIRKLADVEGRRLALRPETAGVRVHFDRALHAIGRSVASLRASVTSHDSHREAVCAVVRGEAEVALSTSGWAARVGLKFLRLATESYDLILLAEHLGLPPVVSLCEAVQAKAFRADLAHLPGYDPADAGQIRYEFDE